MAKNKYDKVGKCKVAWEKKFGKYRVRIPSKTSQILGMGKTKKEAFTDLEDSLKKIKSFKC